MSAESVTTRLYPAGMLNILSRQEVERLRDASRGDLAELVRRCSLAVLNTTVYSAIGDVVDEQELKTGLRQEGIFFAVRTFFAKVANGLGHLLAGIAVDVIGFPSRAVVGEVDPQVIFELGVFEGVLAVVPVVGAVYFYGKYRIDKQRHQQIMDELDTARATVSRATI